MENKLFISEKGQKIKMKNRVSSDFKIILSQENVDCLATPKNTPENTTKNKFHRVSGINDSWKTWQKEIPWSRRTDFGTISPLLLIFSHQGGASMEKVEMPRNSRSQGQYSKYSH